MQAIILAAGRGRRISHLTGGMPKSFLQVNGKRLIERQVEIIKSLGIDDIVITIGFKKEIFLEFFHDDPSIRFIVNPEYERTNTLASFWYGMDFLKEDFLFIHADTIFERGVLERLMSAEGDIIMPIDEHECLTEEMKVIIEDGYIVQISKEIMPDEANGESIGIALVRKGSIPIIKAYADEFVKNDACSSSFESVIHKIIDNQDYKITPLFITDLKWEEIDFVDDYKRAKRLFEK